MFLLCVYSYLAVLLISVVQLYVCFFIMMIMMMMTTTMMMMMIRCSAVLMCSFKG